MAKRGRRRSKIKSKAFSIANRLFPIVKAGAAPLAFIEQISAKDRQTLGSTFSNAGTFSQLKMLANIIAGRTAGLTPFANIDGKKFNGAPQTFNPSGAFNKWTTGGVIGILYGVVGKAINKTSSNAGFGSVLPATSKIMSISKSVFAGGILGGVFDDPINSGSGVSSSGSFPMLNSGLTIQSRGLRTTSSDPVGSGFQQ